MLLLKLKLKINNKSSYFSRDVMIDLFKGIGVKS